MYGKVIQSYIYMLAILCKQLTYWKSPWFWERLRAEREEVIREWDGWTASLMQWPWTWANFGRWWGQRGLSCCSPWGCKESDMTGQHSNIFFQILFTFWLITEYWAEFPVLYSRSLLIVYFKYSSMEMSVPNSQSIPIPPFLPGNHTFIL